MSCIRRVSVQDANFVKELNKQCNILKYLKIFHYFMNILLLNLKDQNKLYLTVSEECNKKQ